MAGSTAKPLTLGLARSSYPTSVEGILAYYPCMCVMRYHDYAETHNAPVLPCTCQRLDIIAAADVSVRDSPCTCQRLDIIATADVRVRDSPCACQRLDIIAATDVSVWELLLYRQRLDIIAIADVGVWELLLYMSKAGHNAVADVSVWKRDALKTPLETVLTPTQNKRAISLATIRL